MGFQLSILDYLMIAAYLVLMLGVGGIFSKLMKGGSDFFVGGRRILWWIAGISLYMTLFSAWTFTGAASFTYNTGWFGVITFATWPLALFIGFILTARRWRRARISTPVEYVTTRFNKATHLFLSIVLIVSTLYWPAHHLASLSKICAPALFPNSMLAIDLMVVVVGLIILLYTFSGGLWAVCFTDVVQFLIFISICGVLIPVVFASGDIGSVSQFIERTPDLQWAHTIRGNTTYTHWYLIGIPLAFIFSYSSGGNIQRYFSVRDEHEARKTGWLAVALFALAPLIFGLPPLIGKVLWPDISALPFFSNISKPDENIFIAVVLKYMPAGMVGLFIAAMMSASMSAMDSAWNVVSAMVSIDIYKKLFKPNATEKETLLVGRLTVVFLAFLAIGMALLIIHSEYGVFTVSNIILGLIGIPVTIPLFVGILSEKISRWSAISSVLAGTITSSLCRFVLQLNLGPQYIVTIIVTLAFLFLSSKIGALHRRSKWHSFAANFTTSVAIYLLLMVVNANTALSFGAGLTSAHVWVLTGVVALLVLSQVFAKHYAHEMSENRADLEDFFTKLKTPIDVQAEVPEDADTTFNAFPLVGKIAGAIAVISLAMLILPEARTSPGVNVAISAMMAVIAGMMFWLNQRQAA